MRCIRNFVVVVGIVERFSRAGGAGLQRRETQSSVEEAAGAGGSEFPGT